MRRLIPPLLVVMVCCHCSVTNMATATSTPEPTNTAGLASTQKTNSSNPTTTTTPTTASPTTTTTPTTTTPPPPNSPRDVKITAKTATSVTLTVIPGKGDYDGYRVQTDGGGIHRNDTYNTTAGQPSLSVSDLTPGTTFTFSVYSRANGLESTHCYTTQDSTSNKVKRSTPDKPIDVPKSPSDVKITAKTATSVTLTVTPGQGGYDGYRVQTDGGGIHRNNTYNKTAVQPSLLVSDLTPGSTFTFSVYTQANGLESTHCYTIQDSTSYKVKRSTPDKPIDVPAPPENVSLTSQTSSITLSVKLPTNCPGCNSVLVKYSSSGHTSTQSCGNPLNCAVEGLTAGICYNFVVYTHGSSGNSTSGYNTTGCTLPGPPTDVMVTLPQTSSIVLAVILPTNCSGCNSFLLKYSPSGHTDREQASTLSCNEKLCNNSIKNLTAGTCYNFAVYTRGSGGYSMEGYNITGCTLPSGPSDVKVSDKTTNSVTLTVTPGPGGYGGYRVKVDNGGNLRNATFNTTDGQHSLLVRGLTSGTTFTFYVYTRANGLESTNFYCTKDSTSNKVKRSADDESTNVPSAPKEVYIYRQTNVSVMLNVTPANNGYDGFLVIYDSLNKSFPNITSEGGSFSSKVLTVDTLIPGTTYLFEVYTCYNDSTSTNYTMISGSTVPNSPSEVTVSDKTATSVTLTVILGQGDYDGYRVQTDGGGIHRNNTYNRTAGQSSLLVSDLTPGTTFTFSVYTQANRLESTHCYTIQDSTFPGLPNNVTVTTQTTNAVTLDIMPPSTGGVDYYNITFTNSDGTTETRQTPTNESSFTVERLTPGYSYNFIVETVYQGFNSTPHPGVPAATVPGPPDGVTLNTQTTNTVTLDITPPSTGGVDYYNITFTDWYDTTETRLTLTNDTSFIVDSLTPGYSYNFTVVSVYQNLISIPYQAVQASTVPAIPEQDYSYNTSNSIIIILQSLDAGNVDSYFSNLDCVSSGNNITPAVTVREQVANITGLSPGTTCTLILVAVFDGLNSSVAVFSGLRTGDQRPGPVEGLGAKNLSATEVSLTWKIPSEPNGEIIQYSVLVKNPAGTCVQHVRFLEESANSSQNIDSCLVTREETFNTGQSDFTEIISNLSAYTRYTFSVFAYTDVGRGLESSSAANTSQAKPYKITGLRKNNISSSNITISFKEPEPVTGPITKYEVQYVYQERVCNNGLSRGDNKTGYTNCTPSSGRTVCLIEKLYPYWDYTISVRAYTSKGSGKWSDPITAKTAEDKPSSIDPNTIRPTRITAYNVTLEWSAPCPPNGVITNYVILWNMSTPIKAPNNSVSYIVPGLLPYRNYTYQIAAETGAGKGNFITGMAFTTLTDAPGPVEGLVAQTLSATEVSLTWKKPTEPNGEIIQYSVLVKNPAGTCVQHVRLLEPAHSGQDTDSCLVTKEETFNKDQSHFSKIISNLLAFTRYTFSVFAYTDVGIGLESSQSTNTSEYIYPGFR